MLPLLLRNVLTTSGSLLDFSVSGSASINLLVWFFNHCFPVALYSKWHEDSAYLRAWCMVTTQYLHKYIIEWKNAQTTHQLLVGLWYLGCGSGLAFLKVRAQRIPWRGGIMQRRKQIGGQKYLGENPLISYVTLTLYLFLIYKIIMMAFTWGGYCED